jgi:recombination DNA repair RAD52 pathway protein
MQKEILDKLYESFELKARPGQGGMTFKYVPSDDIVDRMNKVFMGDWSTEVMQSEVIGDQVLTDSKIYSRRKGWSDYRYW